MYRPLRAQIAIIGLTAQLAERGIARLIEQRTGGAITFHSATLYPTLYRLEARGLIKGQWVERAGQRRRRFYRITKAGRNVLDEQRTAWTRFIAALNQVVSISET